MAQKAGVAVDQFSALAHSANLADLSQEQLVKAAKAWSEEAAKGKSITGDFVGDLLALADQFANAEDGATKVALATRTFGKAGQEIIPLLNQGSAAIREQMEEARRLGLVIGRDFTSNAQTYNDNLKRTEAAFRGLWLQVAQQTLPTLVDLTNRFNRWVQDSGAVQKAAYAVSTSFQLIGEAVDILVSKGRSLSEFFSIASLVGAKQIASGIEAQLKSMVSAGVSGLASLTRGGKAELINPADVARAKALVEEATLSVLTGVDRQLAQVSRATDAALAELERLQIGEQAKADSRLKIQIAFIDNVDRLAEESRQNRLKKEDEDNKRYADDLLARVKAEQDFTKAYIQELKDRVDKDRAAEIARHLLRQKYAAGAVEIARNLQTVAQAFGKKGFEAFKAFRIAEAIASTYAGADRALFDYPWPFSLAVAATVIAAGLANIATIAASKPNGQAHGGLDFVPDDSTWNLSRGERIVQPAANQDLTRFLDEAGAGGGAGRMMQVHIHLDRVVLASAIGSMSRDGLLELDARSVI